MKLTRIWSPAILLLLSLLVGCKPANNLSGAWFGTLDAGHLKLRLVLHIKHEGNGFKATIDTIDQGRSGLPVSAIKVKGQEVHVELGAFVAVFDAKLEQGNTELNGVFRQGGMNIPLTLKKTSQPPTVAPPLLPAAYAPRAGSDLQGYWQGVVTIGAVHTRLGFKISEPSKGKFRGELDSIDQGATGIPVTAITYTPPAVKFDIMGVAGSYDGKLSHAGQIDGTWRQGPNTVPVTLNRVSVPATETANYKFAGDSSPQGVWNASLDVKTVVLRLVLKIGKAIDGTWVAKLDSPDQGSSDIPASTVQLTAPSKVYVEWKTLSAGFDAEFKSGKLVGTWAQGGRTFPLTFQRSNDGK
jgi:hypothetical protein